MVKYISFTRLLTTDAMEMTYNMPVIKVCERNVFNCKYGTQL